MIQVCQKFSQNSDFRAQLTTFRKALTLVLGRENNLPTQAHQGDTEQGGSPMITLHHGFSTLSALGYRP